MSSVEDVLDRRRVDELIGQMQTIDVRQAPDSMRRVRNDLLAHDAALRERLEELESLVEDGITTAEEATAWEVRDYMGDWMDRARQALQEDGDDE